MTGLSPGKPSPASTPSTSPAATSPAATSPAATRPAGTADPRVPVAPGALPLLGHLTRMAADPVGFFERLRGIGPVVRFRLGRREVYAVTSPELVRHMLVGGRADFDKGGSYFVPFIELLGENVATAGDARQRVHRPVLQPAFRHDRMAAYVERMTGHITRHIDGWAPGQVLDVGREMMLLSTGSLSRALFADPVSARVVDRFQRELPVVLDGLVLRMMLPSVARLPLPANRRFDAATRRMRDVIDEMLRHRLAGRWDEDDLLTLLTAPEPYEDGSLTEELAASHIWAFLIGGIDTAVCLMSWTLHLLSREPRYYARVEAEVDSVLGGAAPTYEDLARMPELRRALLEAMRVHPPAWQLSRVAVRPTRLGGYAVPEGADLFINVGALHRDPAYFRDPGRFDPDRWREDRVTRRERDAFMPFGAGPRKCIGDSFALCEAAATLAVLFQRWRVHAVPGRRPVRPRFGMMQHPARLRLRVEPR